MSLEDTIEAFKDAVRAKDSISCVREDILRDGCLMLTDAVERSLYDVVSTKFNVAQEHIFIVGSAKLGFTIKPGNRFRAFNNDSDIDLVIVSPELFERVWMEAYSYRLSGEYWPKRDEYDHYLAKGWIRPDKLPNSRSFAFAKEWWDYFSELTASGTYGRYKISGALYYNRFFFESYQRICVEQLKQELL